MGFTALPASVPAGSRPHDFADAPTPAEFLPDVDSCQSPIERWLGVPTCRGPSIPHTVVGHSFQMSDAIEPTPSTMCFGARPMPWMVMVPVVSDCKLQSPQVNCKESLCHIDEINLSAVCSENNDSESGDAEVECQGGSKRLSPSILRRRRRQRAAAHAVNEQPAPAVKDASAKQCARWLAQLEAGGAESSQVLAELRGSIRRLTFDAVGCRVVQLALESADPQYKKILVKELHGSVFRAIISPHGNYVIQKAIALMPASQISFISEELRDSGAEVARHRFGCRVMCRLLEHSSDSAPTVALINEILQQAEDLCNHSYGHYVIESILEHGLESQKQSIVKALHIGTFCNASDRSFLYVVEKALLHCSPADRRKIQELLPQALAWLQRNASNNNMSRMLKDLMRRR